MVHTFLYNQDEELILKIYVLVVRSTRSEGYSFFNVTRLKNKLQTITRLATSVCPFSLRLGGMYILDLDAGGEGLVKTVNLSKSCFMWQ